MNETVQNSMSVVRNIFKYSQADFAEILGIEKGLLAQIEQNKIELKKNIGLAYIAVVFMKYDDLTYGSMEYKVLTLYIEEFKDAMEKAMILKEKTKA